MLKITTLLFYLALLVYSAPESSNVKTKIEILSYFCGVLRIHELYVNVSEEIIQLHKLFDPIVSEGFLGNVTYFSRGL